MKATDLRIGNWIKYEDKLVQVVQVSSLMILCQRNENQFLVNCAPKVFQPIELTEEVLLKIGFIHRIGMWHFQIIEESKRIEVYYNPPTGGLVAYIDKKDKEFEKIEKFGIRYLHQLQNAYYCLTGEELEVEL